MPPELANLGRLMAHPGSLRRGDVVTAVPRCTGTPVAVATMRTRTAKVFWLVPGRQSSGNPGRFADPSTVAQMIYTSSPADGRRLRKSCTTALQPLLSASRHSSDSSESLAIRVTARAAWSMSSWVTSC
jgi:hypothetical protein